MPVSCCICQDDIDLATPSDFRATLCGHLFHFKCVSNWLKNSSTCPQCRSSLDRSKLIQMFPTVSSLNISKVASSTSSTLWDAVSQIQKQNSASTVVEIELKEIIENLNKLKAAEEKVSQLKKTNETLEKKRKCFRKRMNERLSIEAELNKQICLRRAEIELCMKRIESLISESQGLRLEMSFQETAKKALNKALQDSKATEKKLYCDVRRCVDVIKSLEEEVDLLRKRIQELKTLKEAKKKKQSESNSQFVTFNPIPKHYNYISPQPCMYCEGALQSKQGVPSNVPDTSSSESPTSKAAPPENVSKLSDDEYWWDYR